MNKIYFKKKASLTQNIYGNGDSGKAINNLIMRLRKPIINDEDTMQDVYDDVDIESIRERGKLNKKESGLVARYTEDLSLFNLSMFASGVYPKNSFWYSEFLTYGLKCKADLNSTKLQIQKNPYLQCVFKDYLGMNLIAIFRLDEYINQYDTYKLIFDKYAMWIKNEYRVEVLNKKNPLAFFHLSLNSELYVNPNAKLISTKKELKEFGITEASIIH